MEQKINIDGEVYSLEGLSPFGRETLASIQFVEGLIRQKQNEWAIADTARIAYLNALRRETRQ